MLCLDDELKNKCSGLLFIFKDIIRKKICQDKLVINLNISAFVDMAADHNWLRFSLNTVKSHMK